MDYFFCFPDAETAIRTGVALGFTRQDEEGGWFTLSAGEDFACHVIGEWLTTGEPDENGLMPVTGDGKWWVVFRDLGNREMPDELRQWVVADDRTHPPFCWA